MNLIAAILQNKKKEIAKLPSFKKTKRIGPDFITACRNRTPFVIAEIKPHSPAGEELLSPDRIPEVIDDYSRHAQAISVLCDEKFFHGGFDLLKQVATRTKLPILAKEFFLSPKQIRLAARSKASAILLIPGLLKETLANELLLEALNCDLDVLIEFHSHEDLRLSLQQAILSLPVKQRQKILFGVNNRDLNNLKVNLATSASLIPKLKSVFGDHHLYVAESGIKNAADAKALIGHADGLLIGTALLQSTDRNSFLKGILS